MIYKKIFITALIILTAMTAVLLAAPATSSARLFVGVAVTFAPPALPVYAQPLCPGPGYIWTPGYWAWDEEVGYYWVPGTWVLPPAIGLLWTPGYWTWDDEGFYVWVDGYWGPVVGFYGGIDYGFGYTGFGYEGGYWRGGAFYYNRTVNNINVTNITNVYTKNVSYVRPSGPSYHGGLGGTTARPTSAQLTAAGQKRFSAIDAQKKQMLAARTDPGQRASLNKGRPAIAATAKPGAFKGSTVIKAERSGAPYKAPTVTGGSVTGTNVGKSRAPGIERYGSTAVPEKRGSYKPLSHGAAPKEESAGRTYSNKDLHTNKDLRTTPERRGLANQPIAPRVERPEATHHGNITHTAPNRPETAHQPNTPHISPHRPEMPHQPQKEEHHG